MDASYRMMAFALMAEDASATDGGAGDPFPPGRRDANFVTISVAGWRWSRTVRSLPFVRVRILVLRQLVRRVAGVHPGGLTVGLGMGTDGTKNKKKLP